MKKWTALLLFLFLFWSYDSADAHSGRTDSSGGHNCSEKSQAKGLCTGYHSHNGGTAESGSDSSSESSETTGSSNSSWDKDCTDFATYEEVVEYWNAKGYSRTNDPEKLDGWGNAVDDGIPCEAPSGYDTATVNGSDAQKEKVAAEQAAVLAEQEKADGTKSGYSAGVEAGTTGQEKNTEASGSADYVEGYKTGYEKGFTEGVKQLEAQKTAADKAGYELGKKQDKLVIPNAYQTVDVVTTSFETGFGKGVKERDEEKKKEYLTIGFTDGKTDNHNEPKNVKDIYLTSYQQGYQQGQEELKETYVKQGYNAAFTVLAYKEPTLKNVKYVDWYKEGFKSNQEVAVIQETAYEQGVSGDEYAIPKEYIKAEAIYSHYYKSGKEEYEKNVAMGIGAVGLGLAGWIGRRFYVARKMLK